MNTLFPKNVYDDIGRYFTKAKMKTKRFSGIRYAYSVTTKWVSIEKY